MAKAKEVSPEGQGLTKKQLNRLRRKQKKACAEAGLPLEASSPQNVAALGNGSATEKGKKGKRHDSAVGSDEDVPNRRSTGGRKSEADGVGGGKNGNEGKSSEVLGGAGVLLVEDDDYIRNSLVGKVAEALLRKQLEEAVQAGPAKKKARLANRASEVLPPVEPLDIKPEKSPASTKKEKMKLKREAQKRKKERRKQEGLGVSTPVSRHQGSLESPGAVGEVGSAGGVVPGHSSKKRRRVENDPREKNKKGKKKKNKGLSVDPASKGDSQQQEGVIPKSSSKKRKRAKEETQGKQKQSKIEQSSPWPEIKYEASSTQVSLRSGQSVMIDGAANLTLLSGGASVMGYRLQRDEEVLISSSGQLAPVPIIVYDRRPKKDEGGGVRGTGALDLDGSPGGECGLAGEQSETMLLVRSYWRKKGDAVTNQRTFRLEPKAPAGSSKTIPKPPLDSAAPSPSKTKATDVKLHPVIIPLPWKTVTSSILDSASARTREAVVPGQNQQSGAGVSVGVSAEPGLGAGFAGPPIVAVCGGKNVGKSTYGQYLVNRLLNSYPTVAYLETDVGQPEFTASGLLSLHLLTAPVCGPPSAHLRDPTASFFYGDVSAKTDPELYLRCVVALYDEFRQNYYDGAAEGKRIPLVINTHGWVKGLGLDVLIDILRYTVPTHVVDVQSAKANKNLPPGNFWETTAEPLSQVHYIPTAVPDTPEASTPFPHKFAPEERALRLLAHFQAATYFGDPPGLGFSEKDAYSSFATCLVHHRPFQVPLDSVQILQLHGNLPLEEALWALNGAVVGLARGPGEAETGPLPRCLGLGLVRGIDAAKGILFLVTRLPLSELQNVDTLIQGKVDLPLQLLSAPPYVSPYLAFNSIAAEGTGSAMVKSRNNIVRKVGD